MHTTCYYRFKLVNFGLFVMSSLFQRPHFTPVKKPIVLSEADIRSSYDNAILQAGVKNKSSFFDSYDIHPSPKDVSIEQNMKEASEKAGFFAGPTDYYWFMEQVRNKGPWDYKQRGREFQNFGNYNYGATGYAAGIPENILLRAAGWAQTRAGTSDKNWGSYWFKQPYGDDPEDQHWIKKGIEYAKKSGY